jgi:hypothetical protein
VSIDGLCACLHTHKRGQKNGRGKGKKRENLESDMIAGMMRSTASACMWHYLKISLAISE